MSIENMFRAAFERARAGDVGPLQQLTEVRWCLREVARFGDPLRIEATVTAGGPKDHTLVIDGGWGLATSRESLQQLLRLPGIPQGRDRISIRDLPIDLSHRAWEPTAVSGTWFAPPSAGSNEESREVVARLRLRWEHPGEASQSISVEYSMRKTVRFVREWPSDYPAQVEVNWPDEKVRVRATRGTAPDHHNVHIDLAEALDVPVAWKVRVASESGVELSVKDVALKGNEDGISFQIPTRDAPKALRVHLLPSREVARSTGCVDTYANHALDLRVEVEPGP